MEGNGSNEIIFDCTSNVCLHLSTRLKLTSDKLPFSCELVLKYPKEIQVPDFLRKIIKEALNKCFVKQGNNNDSAERSGADLQARESSTNHETSNEKTLNTGSSTEHKQTDSKSSTSIHPLTEPRKSYLTVDKLPETTNSKPRHISERKERMSYKTDSHLSAHSGLIKTSILENSTWIEMLHNFYHTTSESPTTPTCANQVQSTDSCKQDSGSTFFECLNGFQKCGCPYQGFQLCTKCINFWPYIKHHLEDVRCKQNVCTLWKLCLRKRQYGIFEFAPERMILYSIDDNKIGTITHDYDNYSKEREIGMGGFGRVFQHSVCRETSIKTVAVKEEGRSLSLISDLKRFTSILDLNHPNVLRFQEYIIGHHKANTEESQELPLLLIMEHHDKRGLNEPFIKNDQIKCLLDYMKLAKDEAKYVFRNLLVISLDLFKALDHFKTKGLVHRDVKRSNILLKMTCGCPSTVQCVCDGRGRVTALLSDFDLVETATSDDKWARLGDKEPGGTRGMKAPELFFVNENGKDMFTAKADIWSAFLTIMHVMLGRDVNDEPLKKVTAFFQVATSGIYNSLQDVDSCIKKLQKHCDECKNKNHITENIEVLKKIQANIKDLCRFQSGRQPSSKKSTKERDNYCPAAEVLTAVHGVSTMPQTCIDKLQHVFQFNNPLQESIRQLWNIIQEGMCFHPDDRPDAEQVVGQLNDCLNKFLKSDAFI